MKIDFRFGDCRELIKDIPDDSVDLILTDPPYIGVVKEKWDQQEVLNQDLISEFYRVMKPTASLYVWCGIGEKSQSLMRWWPKIKERFHFKDLITWKKRRGIGMRKGWLYTREEIMWWVKDNKKFIWNKNEQYSEMPQAPNWGFSDSKIHPFKRIPNVWVDVPETLTRKEKKTTHATPKPAKALERIIKCHTKTGDVILDPFAGSGSTLKAARTLNRNSIGFENHKETYDETFNDLREL